LKNVLEAGAHYRFIFFVIGKIFPFCVFVQKSGTYSKNSFMFSIKMTNFRKNSNCPLSSDLLAFQTGKIQTREQERITVHLRFCEFCAAEVEFYAHYPQAEEAVEKTEIPPPLFELAEALLSNKHQNHSLLKRLFNQNDDSNSLDF
jgi:hypothetical protein